MLMPNNAQVPAGIMFPETLLHSDLFAVLAAFVAINTLMYIALAAAKVMPKIYFTDWVRQRSRRSQTRSIHPDPLDP
ncbi:MAG: hypothetical protein ABIR57_06110 [Aeromicrobium sp.]